MDDNKARNFIYKNARPLDLARWKYLFEKGGAKDVLTALSAYQNADGGFGGGLEPDCWNPESSPIQTWAATEIVREIGLTDKKHSLIQGILRYLASGKDFDGHIWQHTLPSNDDYPHAPWWSYAPSPEPIYNPTACLAGFILRFADQKSELFRTACRVAEEAFVYFKDHFPLDSMHTVFCFVRLYEYIEETSAYSVGWKEEFAGLLHKQIGETLSYDSSAWETDYVCKPSLFIDSKTNAFYAGNERVCETECAFISKMQRPDGSWDLHWEWDDYAEAWSVAKNWWKSDRIIKNMRFLKALRG